MQVNCLLFESGSDRIFSVKIPSSDLDFEFKGLWFRSLSNPVRVQLFPVTLSVHFGLRNEDALFTLWFLILKQRKRWVCLVTEIRPKYGLLEW